ncbi:MAG: hypothetical protein IJX03_04770 [Clostridia bacterium]|nr:hypothetical protein [Clostridia bacterium]
MKKFVTLFMALIMVFGTFCFAGCPSGDDSTKTHLYVANYNGGSGEVWLTNVIERFEEKYINESFEPGKTGIIVHDDSDKDYAGNVIATKLASDTNHVYFTNGYNYYVQAATNTMRDITNLVTKTVNVDDGKTIASKLDSKDIKSLTVNNKIYAIPHNEFYYSGITYNAWLWREYNLYFSDEGYVDENEPREFVIGNYEKLSPGPDGKYDTYDDGLPSSYEELYLLIDKMVPNIIPFVWTGKSMHYSNILPGALVQSYLGKNANILYDFDSKGQPVEIVTGFNGSEPEIESYQMTIDNGYEVKSTAALYYAAEFATQIFANGSGKYYPTGCTATTYSNTDAMRDFIQSGLSGKSSDKHIAMLIDGSYWYNEAAEARIFSIASSVYPNVYEAKKDIRYMPLPSKYSGTVVENKGNAPVMTDYFNSFAFINATIPENLVTAAETFLSFCYSDAELVNFTKTTSLIKAVDYDYSSVKSQLNGYAKSIIDLRDAAVSGGTFFRFNSDNTVFLQRAPMFVPSSTNDYWHYGGSYKTLYAAARGGLSAKEWFEGVAISQSDWDSWVGQ